MENDVFSQILQCVRGKKGVEKQRKFKPFLEKAEEIRVLVKELQADKKFRVEADLFDELEKKYEEDVAESFAQALAYWMEVRVKKNRLNIRAKRGPNGAKPLAE